MVKTHSKDLKYDLYVWGVAFLSTSDFVTNETFIFEPNINYILTTGNAGNIKILINNKEIGKLGKKGEVLNSYNFINYLEKIKSN